MHNGVLESKGRCVVASLGFGTVFFAFSNRLCLFPRQIANSSNKLLSRIIRFVVTPNPFLG